jgi:hypothetical protein
VESVEKYARRWIKSEGGEVDTLAEWIKVTGTMTKINFPEYKYFTILILQFLQFPENDSSSHINKEVLIAKTTPL